MCRKPAYYTYFRNKKSKILKNTNEHQVISGHVPQILNKNNLFPFKNCIMITVNKNKNVLIKYRYFVLFTDSQERLSLVAWRPTGCRSLT